MNCKDCIYHVTSTEGFIFTNCQRYPPVPLVMNGEVIWTFPIVNNICGEFKNSEMLEEEENIKSRLNLLENIIAQQQDILKIIVHSLQEVSSEEES